MNTHVPRSGGAMSFAEIGEQLGITAQGAWSIYAYALRKLQRNTPNTLLLLAQLKADLEQARIERYRAERQRGQAA